MSTYFENYFFFRKGPLIPSRNTTRNTSRETNEQWLDLYELSAAGNEASPVA